MLAARRTAYAAPMLSRSCAFLTKMKAMEAETSKLATTLPDGLKEIAESGVRNCPRHILSAHMHCYLLANLLSPSQAEIHASLTKFAAERPALYKAVLAKMEAVRAGWIIARMPTEAAASEPAP